MRLTSQHIQILKLICQDAKRFPHELVTFVPDQLKEGIGELLEAGPIESRAGGYLLTEKGKDVCRWKALLR